MDRNKKQYPKITWTSDAVHVGLSDIMRLHRNAVNGDKDSYTILSKMDKLMAKEANIRLERLERHGYSQYAYEFAKNFTDTAYGGSVRYDENLADADAMYRQILSTRKFLQKPTSRLQGQKNTERLRVETFREMFGLEKKDMSDRLVRDFLRLLGETPIRQLLSEQHHGKSGETVEIMARAYITRPTARREISKLVKQYMLTRDKPNSVKPENKLYYDELMDYLKGNKINNVKILKGKVYRMDT